MATQKIMYDEATVRLTQKGLYVPAPPLGNQMSKGSHSSFTNSVNSSYSVSQQATSLKTKTSTQPVNKTTNYYLTNSEKALLVRKALEFAEPGIVPYDVLEDFLYVLCFIDNYDTMKFVAMVTKVDGLDNPGIIRVPTLILNVPDLNKIGYLANGLASLTRQIDAAKYTQASSAADNNKSAYSSLYNAANALTSAGQSISAFPGVSQFSSVLSQITSVMGTLQGLVSTFSAPGNTATKIGQLSSTLSQVSTLAQNATSILQVGGQQNITSLFPMMDEITNLTKSITMLSKSVETLKNVNSSNSYPNPKVGDINSKLKSIFDSTNSLLTQFASIASQVSNLASPGNVGQAASVLLNQTAGYTPSPIVPQTTLGQKIPPSMLANNPMMLAASNIGKILFGEGLVPMMALDQAFKRPIGVYRDPSSGSGTASFKMQNYASMGGSMSIEQMITRLVYGVGEVTQGSFLSTLISQQATNVASVLGASLTSAVEPRRSDHAIPMMIGVATVLANDSGSPFPTKVFSEGWKIAASVGNDLQNSNPEYLKQIQTTA